MIGSYRSRFPAAVERLLTGLLIVAAAWACGDGPAAPQEEPLEGPCRSANALCLERIEVAEGLRFPVYRTHDLEAGDAKVEMAVIVIHGTNRDADAYFATMVAAAGAAHMGDRAVIVSPNFHTEADGPADDEPRWTSGGWKRGDPSLPSGPGPAVSSYAVLDRILDLVTDPQRFPSVQRVSVVGHSAGGQVVHRYAATSPWEDEVGRVPVRYVPANPSTWLYLGPERWTADGWAVPDTAACPDYDDWHYGLRDRNPYASTVPADTLRARLRRRDVRMLAGDADRGSANLDQSCGANLQGAFRRERAQRLHGFMDALWAPHRHTLTVIPDVGHSSSGMFTSSPGLAEIFLP